MNRLHNWLYENYAAPLIDEIEAEQRKAEEQLVQELSLTPDQEITLDDAMIGLRLRWGGEIFILGLQLGLRLANPGINSAGSCLAAPWFSELTL